MILTLKERNKLIKQYIIDSIYVTSYEDNIETDISDTKTDQEKLQYLFDRFISEKWNCNNIKKYHHHNIYAGFQDWIQGLPSSFNIAWTYADIIPLAIKTGSLPDNPTEQEEDKILNNYFNYITVKTFQLFKKYNITEV